MTNMLKAPEPSPPSPASPLWRFYRSPIGKKVVSGVTGLGLAIFVLVHMLGNLLLFAGSEAYNSYAHHLENWGVLLYAIEAVLVGAVLFHGAVGLEIFVGRLRARPQGYRQYQSVGGSSYQSFSSRTMILTGTVLAVFLIVHLWTFKFGTYYPAQLNGEPARDLARLVVEVFQKLPYTLGYSVVLLLLGLHLRHGLWSGLQSLGTLHSGIRPIAYGLSAILAAAIALGFVILPWAIYWGVVPDTGAASPLAVIATDT
ncbi:MAG TPA: succinate dehydrogenase cytochrome b subunit [Leptolyngbyaceae cyanobacterium M65_K2018_010]|nr:succinate dehydrogenase cytochrome b subunit [Leptolyngbyaceae cyanobacterium M65_K2018_010]